MAFLLKAFILLAVVYVQLGEAAEPDRCLCVRNLPFVKKDSIEKFFVSPPRPNCNNTEIIVTLRNAEQRCVSPEKHQGKILQKCWKSKNMNNTATMKISVCFEQTP